METGRHLFILSSIFLLLTTFPCFIEAVGDENDVMCNKFKTSVTVYEFYAMIQDWGIKGEKLMGDGELVFYGGNTDMCDNACFAWLCVVNYSVIYGGGCYSDFKGNCTGSTEKTNSATISAGINQEQYNFLFIYKGKKRPFQANAYLRREVRHDDKHLNYFLNEFLNVTVNTATPPTTTTLSNIDTSTSIDKSDSDNNGLMNQINGFKFFGMILLGFFFAQI